jgi:hypothetical protein
MLFIFFLHTIEDFTPFRSLRGDAKYATPSSLLYAERSLLYAERSLLYAERSLLYAERPLLYAERPLLYAERPLGISTLKNAPFREHFTNS